MSKGFSKKATESKWESWTTGGGVTIKVCDMTESHAKNVLNVLLKRNKNLRRKLDALKDLDKDFTKFLEEDSQWGKG